MTLRDKITLTCLLVALVTAWGFMFFDPVKWWPVPAIPLSVAICLIAVEIWSLK